ncbi:glycosyl transferase family 2 [Rhodanobacter thiooxydans]|uniref:Glycosyl transferase family 2 n=1 Tax=Rhodanobacter thiooxydans TaxID=416169 RepID=A0A154QKA9_9GAMM|nr:glycosyltransferase family 2 protein [Rhodanobacter thiooxydans]EIL98628.1 glycosyl transferase family protein [Rhodanobacter thiooxydans LCS2]KZC24275.1 glycosyl transferase family 2 [Rhodanobacter thiooxydans]MCW0201355.1 glycosyltransferase family 2 protein [Rhodanobacter thiooxydans]
MTSFAVVVTSYNYRAFVGTAIDSALAQSRAPMQVIVVDDGSTDGTPAHLRERYGHDPRVTLVCGENGGQLVAFQRGVAHARADVVCFLDADDRWAPDYLAHLGELYDRRRDVDFVFSDMQLFGDEQRWEGYAEHSRDLGFTAISTYALMHWYGAPTSALSMRALWARRTLELPAELGQTWRLSADNCLVFGASVLGARKYYLRTGAVHYRIHGNNGWWGRQTPATTYLNRFRSRCLIGIYARSIGLDERCLESVKHEFRTKPDPSWREARHYAKLARLRHGSWLRNLQHAASILWSTLKRRRPGAATRPATD